MKLKHSSDLRWNSHCGHWRKTILNYRINLFYNSCTTNIILIVLDVSLFIASVNFTISYIIPRFKLPIVSKKSFLQQNKSLLITKLNNYNLNFEDVVIDYKNLEILLNKDNHKSMKKLKMLKRAQKIGGQNDW